ncbi:RNA-directed DNA polymerase [Ectothiorhodospiraceae bacterium BW-2]|nr:RNA-directed DNA polymerase [Ectothiorhodospiraceae bacterium BW-2]
MSGRLRPMPTIVTMPGMSISTMATPTTTTVPTLTVCGWFVAESDTRVAFDYSSLYHAWLACRRRKRRSPQAQRYEVYLLDNLATAVQALQRGTWRPSRSVVFVTTHPKAREIHAAPYADRVIHHWLVPRLERLYEPILIDDLYSNRRNKGSHTAVVRLQHFMRSVNNQAQPAAGGGYYLQLDIRNFFHSIDKVRLFQLLQHRLARSVKAKLLTVVEAERLRDLSHHILKPHVGREARWVGPPQARYQVPAHKRLESVAEGKGLPIGNLTSQFFANVYLNELDQFIKHQLKCRHYIRYVDDFILLHPDRGQLQQWQHAISDFLAKRLQLQLKASPPLRPIHNGADFLGYIVRPHYLLVRRRVIGHLRQKLYRWQQQNLLNSPQSGQRLRLSPPQRESLRALLASYLGHFRHASSHRLIASLFEQRYRWLSLLFYYREGRLTPLWQPQQVSSYRSQVRYFRRTYPYSELTIQRGSEFDHFQPLVTAPSLSRSPFTMVRHIHVIESGYLRGGLKRRQIHFIDTHLGVNLCSLQP